MVSSLVPPGASAVTVVNSYVVMVDSTIVGSAVVRAGANVISKYPLWSSLCLLETLSTRNVDYLYVNCHS